MKLYRWFQLILSKAERGLWYDHDEREYDSSGWGLCIKLYGGWVFRPIPRPSVWISLLTGNPALSDAWNNFNPDQHIMIKFWFPVLPFISVALGPMGFYAGFKTFSTDNERYRAWGVDAGGYALTPSISTRMTRWT